MSDSESDPGNSLDFRNTEIAFDSKSNSELKRTAWLFSLMKNQTLVNILSPLGLLAIKLHLPFAKSIIRRTIFKQFVGGENLLDSQEVIDHLHKYNTLTILDYGAESKSTEDELDEVSKETVRALELAASNDSVPCISCKITGLAPNELLLAMNKEKTLSDVHRQEYDKLMARLHTLGARAKELGVTVLVDAEESWMQIAIDNVVDQMMEMYNTEKPVIYNTYQLYRHDKLAQLKKDHKTALEKGYFLGAKLVRGAYMDKERSRAEDQNYPSPIHENKEAVDRDFDEAIAYCVEHYETIGSICASHNIKSNLLQAQLIEEKELDKKHPHLNFCQLYGMSDYITFNLAEAGFNVAKYVPYGPIKEVIPYLIRRAKENSSVTGEVGRELQFINEEMKRRGL